MKTKHIILHLIIGFVLILNHQTQAQRRTVVHLPKFDLDPYHFGFILAGNQMMLTWKPVDNYQDLIWTKSEAPDIDYSAPLFKVDNIISGPVPGFAVGIVGNLRLGNYFDLRFIPTLAFGDRYIDYTIQGLDNDEMPIGNSFVLRKSLPSTMVDFPLHVKYRSKRLNNFAAYVIAGGKYSIEMASTKKIMSVTGNYPVKIDRNDFSGELGAGFDFYTPYFKFGTELKMSYGIKNSLIKDEFMYSKILNSLHNKVFQLSFTFE